jgi:hypothetical protein
VAPGEVTAQFAGGIFPTFIGCGSGRNAGIDAEGMQEAIDGERVKVTLIDIRLFLEDAGVRRTESSGKASIRPAASLDHSARKRRVDPRVAVRATLEEAPNLRKPRRE